MSQDLLCVSLSLCSPQTKADKTVLKKVEHNGKRIRALEMHCSLTRLARSRVIQKDHQSTQRTHLQVAKGDMAMLCGKVKQPLPVVVVKDDRAFFYRLSPTFSRCCALLH